MRRFIKDSIISQLVATSASVLINPFHSCSCAKIVLVPLEGEFIAETYDAPVHKTVYDAISFNSVNDPYLHPDLPTEFWSKQMIDEFPIYEFIAEFMRLCWGYGTDYTIRQHGRFGFDVKKKDMNGPIETYIWGGSHIGAERHFGRVPFDKDHDIIVITPDTDLLEYEILFPLINKYKINYGENSIWVEYSENNIGWHVGFQGKLHVSTNQPNTDEYIKTQEVYLDIWAYDFIDPVLYNSKLEPYSYNERPAKVDVERKAIACTGKYKLGQDKHCMHWPGWEGFAHKPALIMMNEYMPAHNALLGPFVLPRFAIEERILWFNYTGFMDNCRLDSKVPRPCSEYYNDYYFAFEKQVVFNEFEELQIKKSEFMVPSEGLPQGMVYLNKYQNGNIDKVEAAPIDKDFSYKYRYLKKGSETLFGLYEKTLASKKMYPNRFFINEQDLFDKGYKRRQYKYETDTIAGMIQDIHDFLS